MRFLMLSVFLPRIRATGAALLAAALLIGTPLVPARAQMEFEVTRVLPDDSNPGSLRWAVEQALALDDAEAPGVVTFDPALNPGDGSSLEIQLTRPLPAMEQSLIIDGTMVSGLIIAVGFGQGPDVCPGNTNLNPINWALTVCDADVKLIDTDFDATRLSTSDVTQLMLYEDDGRLIYSTRNFDLRTPNNFFGGGDLAAAGPGKVTLTGLSDFARDDPDNAQFGAGQTQVIGGTLVGDTSSLIGDIFICGDGDGAPCTDAIFDDVDREYAPGRDGALLVFDITSDATFGAVTDVPLWQTSGSGTMAKDGAGKLTFDATMAHTGGTEIWEGSLEADADSLSGPIHICSLSDGDSDTTICEPNQDSNGDDLLPIDDPANNPPATLILDQASDGTLADSVVFSGYGGIEKTGAGSLTMDADNDSPDFHGPLSIAGGALALEGVDLSVDAFTMESGTALRGDNAMIDASSVAIRGADLVDLGNRLDISSTSSITFGGTNTLSGDAINLDAPTIRVQSGASLTGTGYGLTLSSTLDVGSGATFGGSGDVVGNVDVSGTLSLTALTPPTATTSGFTVNNVTFAAGSRLSTIVDPDDIDATRLDAAFNAIFDDATTIAVAFEGGNDTTVARDQQYRLVQASTLTINPDDSMIESEGKAVGQSLSLTDTPSDCPSGFGCLDLIVTVGDVPLTDIANTPNESSVATQLDAAGAAACTKTDNGSGGFVYTCDGSDFGDIFFDLQFRTPESTLPDSLDQMAGAGLGAFTEIRLAANSRFTRSIARRFDLERSISDGNGMSLLPGLGEKPGSSFAMLGANALPQVSASGSPLLPPRGGMGRHPGKGGWTSWGDLHGVFASYEGDYAADDTDYRIYGPLLGVDYGITDHITLGGTFGYQRSEFQTTDDYTKGTANTYSVGAYMGALGKHGYVTSALRYAYSQMLTRRHIEWGGLGNTPDSRIAHGDFDGQEISLFAEAAWAFDVGRGFTVQPTAALTYDHLEQDAFDEEDADSLDLSVDEVAVDVVQTFIGVRTGFLGVAEGTTYVHPQLRVGWERTWTGRGGEMGMLMPKATGSGPFEVDTLVLPKDLAVVGVTTETGLSDSFNLFLEYDARIASGFLENSVALGFRYTW